MGTFDVLGFLDVFENLGKNQKGFQARGYFDKNRRGSRSGIIYKNDRAGAEKFIRDNPNGGEFNYIDNNGRSKKFEW